MLACGAGKEHPAQAACALFGDLSVALCFPELQHMGSWALGWKPDGLLIIAPTTCWEALCFLSLQLWTQ